MNDEKWREEWNRLTAERDAARRRWSAAADTLAARARDPLGIKATVGRHPAVAAGIGAAVAGLIATLFVAKARGKKKKKRGVRGLFDRRPASPAVDWESALKSVAVSVATPLVTKFVVSRLARFMEPAENGHGPST
jgi:hypothetical protein